MKQDDLNNYFSTVWKSNLDQYKYSGWALVDKIQPGELVLDVGCGFNEFKSKIPNLLGIDPAMEQADVKQSIEQFSSDHANFNQYDVAFCLGSINFGGEANIISQINCVVRCLKPQARIYWRCNPGLADHGNDQCRDIDFFPWTMTKQADLAGLFGFRVNRACWDSGSRIYAEWHR